MLSWSNCKDWAGIGKPALGTERLDLTDLLEISDLLLQHGHVSLRVSGWSMSPTLCKGDRLTVEPVSAPQLQVGELVLFHHRFPQGLRLLCHRLVAVDDAGPVPRLITKGDAVTGDGEVIQPDQVLGRVVGVRPRRRWTGPLAKRIDRWLARLRDEVAQVFLAFQGLRSYRRMMRSIMLPCFDFYWGASEGTRWFSYHPISRRGGDPIGFMGRRDFHLLAKLGGTSVGSLEGKAVSEGYRIENLYVRIRYRGMGVGSHLLALAATAASRSGARVLLASVEPANTAVLHLLTKMGFRKTGGLRSDQVSLRRDL